MNSMKKSRFGRGRWAWCGLALFCVCVGLLCAGEAWATTYDISESDYDDATLILNDSSLSPVTITGTRATGSSTNKVAVWIQPGFNSGTVILENVSIDLSNNTGDNVGPIYVGDGGSELNVTILLSGDNELKAGGSSAGLQISGSAVSVAFDSATTSGSKEGTLVATGSEAIYPAAAAAAGAGIGSSTGEPGGKITIYGGTITANGGTTPGAGVGNSGVCQATCRESIVVFFPLCA